jgi:hypothetical protein
LSGFPPYIGLSGREVGLGYWGGERFFFSTTTSAALFIPWKSGKGICVTQFINSSLEGLVMNIQQRLNVVFATMLQFKSLKGCIMTLFSFFQTRIKRFHLLLNDWGIWCNHNEVFGTKIPLLIMRFYLFHIPKGLRIDGTERPIERPQDNQKQKKQYSGKKKSIP